MWITSRLPRSIQLTGGIVFALSLAILLVSTKANADSLTFSGTVVTPSGVPYTGQVPIGLNSTTGGGGYWVGTGSDGTFTIAAFPSGTYDLQINVPANETRYAAPAPQRVTITSNVSGFTLTLATPALKGVLATPDGTPTSGCISAHNSTWTVNRNSCPDSTGVFVLGALDAGTYIFETTPPQNSSYVGTSQSVTITDSSATLDLGTVRLGTPFIIGKVALPDGSALVWSDDNSQRLHLSVDLNNSDWTINKHSDYDANSTFKFGQVPAGVYNLHVNIWDTEVYTGSANVSMTVPAEGLDMTSSPVRITTPQLSGIVYDADGTTPLSNVWVNVHTEDWSVNQGGNTDSTGKYRIGGSIAAGTYQLDVNPPQDRPDLARPDTMSIAITASLTTKNITLSKASKFITGTVKTKGGKGVSCANINANKLGGGGWANTQTASDGSYTLTVAAGSWSLNVSPSSGWNCLQPDWIYMDSSPVVDFDSSATSQTETLNFTVTKATAKITGTVKTKSGSLVTSGSVNANMQSKDGRNLWQNGQIGADGTYKINVIAGAYDLNVWTQNNQLFAKNQKVSVDDGKTATVNFTMGEKLAHIKGSVTDASGNPLQNVQINGNLDCGPNGCSAWSNTTTDASGNFDLAATAGRWNLNVDTSRGSLPYVYGGQPMDVYVSSETATVTGVVFALTYADVTVTGNVVGPDGKKFADFPGWAYVRPLTVSENGWREYGGPINGGKFSFRVPSKLFSQAELGIHMGPNSAYTATPATITLIADATIQQDVTVQQNNAAVYGRFQNSAGLPLGKCDFSGEVFANTENGEWHGTTINPDCTYEMSLLAGTYRMGYHVTESSGVLNSPPRDDKVEIQANTRVEKNLKVLVGDAQVRVLILKPDGTPADRVWLWADNHEEVDNMRRQMDNQQQGDNFKGPGGTTSPEELFKYCAKSENEKECADFKLPPGSEGPGGCKDALACTKTCKQPKNKSMCDKAVKGTGKIVTSSTVKLSASVLRRKAAIASLKPVHATADSGKSNDPFDNMMINSGTESVNGVATLWLISGHEYTIGGGLPPESNFMPPKFERVNLKSTKEASVTLQLGKPDGKMSGVALYNGTAIRNGWVNGWCENGTNTGSPIVNGTYQLNYAFNSVCHFNAGSNDGSTFLHSEDTIVTIGTQKSMKVNFNLGKASFDIPPSITDTWDATTPKVLTLGDGTTVNIPSNTIASSGDITVSANPTINVQSQTTAIPVGYGYNFTATGANGQEISTFNGNITACFHYSDGQLSEFGLTEATLVPSYWDTGSKTWKKPSNVTQDTDNNTVCTTTNHFTSFAVVGTGGGKGGQLTQVRTSSKKGVPTVVIGTGKSAKTITPFPGYKGGLSVSTGTASAKAGQIILAVQTSGTTTPTTLKVYTVKGKLSQSTQPWGSGYRGGAQAQLDDVTGDGYADGIIAPNDGSTALVTDYEKKRTFTVNAGGKGRVIAQGIDLQRTGSKQLAVAVNNKVKTLKYNSSKKVFAEFGFDGRKIAVHNDSIERVVLQPAISTMTPDTVKVGTKGSVVVTIIGQNFGSGSKVFLDWNIVPTKVRAEGETKLTATFKKSVLGTKSKRYRLTVVNPDGVQTTKEWFSVKK